MDSHARQQRLLRNIGERVTVAYANGRSDGHALSDYGSHAVDCEGCRDKVAAILLQWVYDRERDELPEAPGEVAARVLAALASDAAS